MQTNRLNVPLPRLALQRAWTSLPRRGYLAYIYALDRQNEDAFAQAFPDYLSRVYGITDTRHRDLASSSPTCVLDRAPQADPLDKPARADLRRGSPPDQRDRSITAIADRSLARRSETIAPSPTLASAGEAASSKTCHQRGLTSRW